MLTDYKERLNTAPQSKTTNHTAAILPPLFSNHSNHQVVESFTPPGSPPQNPLSQQLKPSMSATSATEPASIIAALGQLANIARQQNTAAAAAPPQLPAGQNRDSYMSDAQINAVPAPYPLNMGFPLPVNVSANSYAPQPQVLNNGASNFATNPPPPPFTGLQSVPPPSTLDPAVQQQLLLIKGLADAGATPEQIAGFIASLGAQGPPRPGPGGAPLPPPLPFPLPATQMGQNGAQNGWGAQGESRDMHQHDARSPNRYPARRSRSRSPIRGWAGGGTYCLQVSRGFDYELSLCPLRDTMQP
jgi:protein NRD1